MGGIFTVAGIAICSSVVQTIMEHFGHGDKVVFVKIIGYVACAFIAWNVWWDLVHYIESSFGVMGGR